LGLQLLPLRNVLVDHNSALDISQVVEDRCSVVEDDFLFTIETVYFEKLIDNSGALANGMG
jgi:hypothetical protein